MTEDIEHRLTIHVDFQEIAHDTWEKLVGKRKSSTPFVSHNYLSAMFKTQCASPATGWQPAVLALYKEEALTAACLFFIKNHSRGEYVFDFEWARAYENAGLSYYPKILCSTPFTPVTGPRLLGVESCRKKILKVIERIVISNGFSSAHILFIDEEDKEIAIDQGWLLRKTVQFHWTNKKPEPFKNFDDFLECMHREKRKKIARERRYIAEAGINFLTLRGEEISAAMWDFFYNCYTNTHQEHYSEPYLTKDFFLEISRTMPKNWLMFIAEIDAKPIAASLICLDEGSKTAFGRYWGCTTHVSFLHFEACYYQPIAWCIDNRFHKFEGGAQGEHKLARGMTPTVTWSAHWLPHQQFKKAVADHLSEESDAITAYVDELRRHQPFKKPNAESN